MCIPAFYLLVITARVITEYLQTGIDIHPFTGVDVKR